MGQMDGYPTIREAFNVLNDELNTRYTDGKPIKLDIEGRPKFNISSLDPIVCERYGTFRNKAPYVAGSLALRSFLTQPDSEGGAYVIAAVEAESQCYGFYIDSTNPEAVETINVIARQLGYPNIQITP